MSLLNLTRAERILDEEGLDGLLASSFENVLYLSNVWCDNFLALPKQTQFYCLAARRDLSAPAVACGINEVGNVLANYPPAATLVTFGAFYRFVEDGADLSDLDRGIKERVIDGLRESRPGPAEALVDALLLLGLSRGRVAYDERGFFPDEVRGEVERRLPDLKLVPGYQTFRRVRAVKTEAEVERLVRALRLNEHGIEAAMAMAREGVAEREMVAEYERAIVSGRGRPLMSQIFFGPHGSTGWVRGRDAVLRRGEVIRFDVGCMLDGYYSDIARNYCVGQPAQGERVQGYYDAILAAEQAAVDAMRPGVPASEIFQAGVAAARHAGIPHYQRTHIGHGIGLEMYDIPLLGPNDHTPLEAGMVFEVETPYYELGFPGLQIEDTVLLREGGAAILAGLDRSFQVLEV